jgi:hypothetical protein
MNGRLRIAMSIACLTLSTIIVGFAYFSDYDSVLTKPNASGIILLLLLINVIGNIAQIEDFLEKLLGHKTGMEKELYETLDKAARDIEILISYNKSQSPAKTPGKGTERESMHECASEDSYLDSVNNERSQEC